MQVYDSLVRAYKIYTIFTVWQGAIYNACPRGRPCSGGRMVRHANVFPPAGRPSGMATGGICPTCGDRAAPGAVYCGHVCRRAAAGARRAAVRAGRTARRPPHDCRQCGARFACADACRQPAPCVAYCSAACRRAAALATREYWTAAARLSRGAAREGRRHVCGRCHAEFACVAVCHRAAAGRCSGYCADACRKAAKADRRRAREGRMPPAVPPA